MVSKELQIVNRLGLHGRAAAKLINLISRFSAHVVFERQGQLADGRSIMSIWMLALSRGTCVKIYADGEDEEQVIAAIEALLANLGDN